MNEQDNPARIRFRFFSLIWHSPNLIFVKCCSSSKLGHIIFLDEVFLILESFQGFSLFSYQGSLLLSIKRGNLFILPRIRPLVNNFLKIILKKTERRRRDLNPRAAVNDLHPFQGCPFGQLGYFCLSIVVAKKKEFLRILFHWCYHQAERVGFEPTRPCGQTVFKTASL